MIFWIWIAAILVALFLFFRQVYSRFSRYGVKHLKPVPILGNLARIVFRKEHFVTYVIRNYSAFPDERFIGTYEFMAPTVNIRDPELIKKITVKDFEHFLDHRPSFNKEREPLLGKSLLSLTGQDWKDMRSSMSPAFTSSKIRNMVPFMVEVGEQMISSLKKKIQESKDGYIDIDVRDVTTRYANDVIASCAFGLKVDSQAEENNQFYEMGKAMSSFTFKQTIILFLNFAFPKLMKILNISLLSEKIQNFYRSLVQDTMKERELGNIFRPDMIHLLMEAKKGKEALHDTNLSNHCQEIVASFNYLHILGLIEIFYETATAKEILERQLSLLEGKLKHDDVSSKDATAGFATVEESSIGKNEINKVVWSDDDLTAQVVIFLLAGFDTISTSMTLLIHELTSNPDVQEKLVQEIKQNEIKNDGKFDYKSIQQMPYLDTVISELLRMWPPGPFLERYCTKDYNLGRPNNNATHDYIVHKGESVLIPMWAIHYDPKYYPDPLKFDPERFSEENKHKIKPFTYMPFGLGPRNCIGSRLALCEVKVMMYQLLKNMELSPNEKTQLGNEIAPDTLNLRLVKGHWVRLRIRS